MFLWAEPQHPHSEAQAHFLLYFSITLTCASLSLCLSLCFSLMVMFSWFLNCSLFLLLCSASFCLSLCLSFDLSTLPPLPQACHELQDDLETFLPHLPEPVGDYSSQMTSLDPELYPIQTTTHSHIQPNLAIPDRIWPYLPCCS